MHRGGFKQEHRKLVDVEERLKQSQESKARANEKTSEVGTKLKDLHENMQRIAQDKNTIERELKFKEQECVNCCLKCREKTLMRYSTSFFKRKLKRKRKR